jgi:predicted dehydrogenase
MLKGAIIGFGEVARHGHWPAYAASSQLRIAAVVDRTPERRRLATLSIPGVQTFSTVDELASAMGPALDFVDVCTPPAFHQTPMSAALAQGWHVICEKPLLLDLDAVAYVRQQARDRRLAIVPVHNWKYAPIIRRVGELLANGAIGTLRRVQIETRRPHAAPTAARDGTNWRRDMATSSWSSGRVVRRLRSPGTPACGRTPCI